MDGQESYAVAPVILKTSNQGLKVWGKTKKKKCVADRKVMNNTKEHVGDLIPV